MLSRATGFFARFSRSAARDDVSFAGETLDLDIRPTFAQKYLGPDFGRELLFALTFIGWIGFFLFCFFIAADENSFHDLIYRALATASWQIGGSAGLFSVMRRKRVKTSHVLVGREALRADVKKEKKTVPQVFRWAEIKDVVRIMGSDGAILQVNIVLNKNETIAIYDTSDIYRLLEFLKKNVRVHIAGVEHYYVYSMLPVVAFAAAAAFCLVGVYWEDDLVRLTVDFLDRFTFGK